MAIVVAGAALAIQSASAANNDLILSINNNSGSPAGTTEFTVNLGNISTFTPVPNYDLSSFMSTFNSQYASAGVSGLNVGVVGGQNGQGPLGNGVGNDVFTTTLRTSGGSYTAAGSSAPGASPAKAQIANAGGIAGGFSGFSPNKAIGDGDSFTTLVAKDPTTAGTAQNSFTSYLSTADDPLSTMTGTKIVLDMWKDTQISTAAGLAATSGWVYQGNFTLDLSGAQPSLIWDAAAPVPEPSTYGLFGGFGLLALSLRRQFRSKNA